MTDMSKVTPENIIQKLHLHKPEQTPAVCMIAIQEIERLRAARLELLLIVRKLVEVIAAISPHDTTVAGIVYEIVNTIKSLEEQ